MSFCPNCGSEINGNPLFCPECGAYLMNAENQENGAAPQQSQPTPEQQAPVFAQQQQQPHPPVQQSSYQPHEQQPQQPTQQTYYQPPTQQQQPAQQAPYQPPVQQQQQAYNSYNYDPSAVQPMQEEKASTGLAILSFFIPLVGLILFFVKKNKQPKTAKACITAAAISILLSTVVSLTSKNKLKNEVAKLDEITTVASSEETTESAEQPAYDGVVYGTFDDKEYVNKYFGVKYTLPENFAFDSYENIANSTGDQLDSETGLPMTSYSTMKFYFDSMAVSTVNGSNITTMIFPANFLSDYADLKPDEYLQSVVEGGMGSRDNVNISDLYSLAVGDQTCYAMDATFSSEGVDLKTTYFIIEKDGSMFITQIMTTSNDTMEPKAYTAYFSAAE